MYGSVFSVLFFSTIISLCELTDPENCTLKANLPCWMHTLKDGCTPDELKLKFSDLYAISDANPGPVSNFSASLYYAVRPQNNQTYPGVKLIFTPPNDGSISFLKGFHISRIRSSTPGKVFCYVFNMSGASWSAENDKNIEFILPIFPIKPGDTYMYDLYTLPKPAPDFVQSRHVSVQATDYANSNSPGNWSTIITFYALHEYGIVVTKFESPPEKFAFQRFRLTLWSASVNRTIEDKTVSDTTYWFNNVAAGIYEIWVQPVDPFLYDPSHCLCREAAGGCGACITTKTLKFTVKDVETVPLTTSEITETTETTESPPAEKDTSNTTVEKVIIAVFGSLGAVLLVAVVVVFYWYRCRKGQYGLKDENHNVNDGFEPEAASVITLEFLKNGGHLEKYNNVMGNKVMFPVKKKVFLLYEEDHKYHRLVIDKFATYLSLYCQCDVELAELQHDAAWVHQDLAQAEYVVIVNSEAAFKANLSSNAPKLPGKNTSISSINSIRNRFMRDERYDHIIMVYFSYTDEKYILPEICTGYKYKLMKHFTDFLLHVHKLHRTDNLSRYDLPFDGNHTHRPVGQELLDSIDEAAKFEAENPNWYIQTHGIRRGISNTSQDSWHRSGDSGFPEDITPLPTPIYGPNDPWSNVNSQRPSDTKSAVTVMESDLNSVGELPNLYQKSLTKQRPQLRLSLANPKDCNKPFEEMADPPIFLPPTDSPTDVGFDFMPPDSTSNFDAMSHTLSKQLEGINNRYTETLKDLADWKGLVKCQSEADEGQGQYDKEADLAILDAHSREVMFNSAMEGDSFSLSSVGGVSM